MTAAERARYALQMTRCSLRRHQWAFAYGGAVSGRVEVQDSAWRRAVRAPRVFRQAWIATGEN